MATELSKSVEAMSMADEEPPSAYIVKGCSFAPSDLSSSSSPFPVIDISLFSSISDDNTNTEVQSALHTLRSALTSTGCFQAIGHGMSGSFLDKIREMACEFFELPAEEKQKYGRSANESEGYGSDMVVSEKQVLDWSHRLSLRVFPEAKRRIHLWPKTPADFSAFLHEYSIKIKEMMEILYKAMARSLNLEENCFSSQFGEASLMQARFNFYPKCSRPDLVLGVKPHTDRSGITVLLQDKQVEGLQILVDDRWVRVPVISDAFVVNLGDQMQIMSNGIFKSPMHRVVTNTERLRLSIALFHEPEVEKEIGAVDGLISEERPRLYRNVKNYGAINYECYQKGIVALETVKL
ncbi:codeine O-demethylase-like [Mercurialis annua]|uniref:codeine O-demethylase-like n=1 Tax=Mercurialis annua TaxID=3986 RepID=UPI00215EDECB|nr:codeine O-demethylase-like [Mercurialis annua]